MRKKREGEECQGTVTTLLSVTHTDVQGGKEEQGEERGENRRTEKVK